MNLLHSLVRTPLNLLGYDLHRISLPSRSRAVVDEDEEGRRLTALGIDKVHYGCGANFLTNGWLNVDFRDAGKIGNGALYARIDLTERHPFPDDFFRLGFSEDFLEHLDQEHSLRFLIEAYRTLKQGGILRLSFPGLEGVLGRHYVPATIENAVVAMVDAYEKYGHLHFYSQATLELVAKHIGFSAVEFKQFRISDQLEFQHLEVRQDQADLNTYAELHK